MTQEPQSSEMSLWLRSLSDSLTQPPTSSPASMISPVLSQATMGASENAHFLTATLGWKTTLNQWGW
eukprot:CAMPEP_0115112180 /NCGR_PEP_ID=MMETSP0227-20121206/40516_1 /TAXON_ID=89957 /ORGANISM="Polarella glacialis, Strain CCMP 1383" /LENGTH=66 /DNA_ID=CAMNT_0002511757 /DNA_START=78 /DNA_END=278 /DNA_ORIENTATION=-